jgi:UDP-N-acetylglucosamine 2-epimerase
MRILIVGEQGGPHALAGALEDAGVDVERPPEGAFEPARGGEVVAEIAAALLTFERLFVDGAPDAVLLVSASNLALAAVLVATKRQIPVASLDEGVQWEDRTSELNRRLIEQLADRTVGDDAGTIVASLRDLAGA